MQIYHINGRFRVTVHEYTSVPPPPWRQEKHIMMQTQKIQIKVYYFCPQIIYNFFFLNTDKFETTFAVMRGR